MNKHKPTYRYKSGLDERTGDDALFEAWFESDWALKPKTFDRLGGAYRDNFAIAKSLDVADRGWPKNQLYSRSN
jgi:hypothetical protein